MIWYVIKNNQWKHKHGDYVMTRGWGNGYVAVPPSHVLYKKDYDDVNINIHGGLTYSQYGNGLEAPLNWWVFGFDTGHWNDNLKTWSKEKVIEETMELFWQLFEIEWGEL